MINSFVENKNKDISNEILLANKINEINDDFIFSRLNKTQSLNSNSKINKFYSKVV